MLGCISFFIRFYNTLLGFPSRADRIALLNSAPSDSDSKNFAYWPFRTRNHNVVVTWIQCVLQGSADSIWTNTVLASFVYELMSTTKTPNAYAGYVEAAQGIANLVFALPVGLAADKGSKSRIVAIGGLLIPLAVGITSYAVIRGVQVAEDDENDRRFQCFGIFLGSMCLWGIVSAIASGPAQAIYADSVVQGERSYYYTILFSLYLLASTLGPIVTIFMFWLHGNGWTLPELQDVFLTGLGLELAAAVCLFCFRDHCTLEQPDASPPPKPDDGLQSVACADGHEATGCTASAAPAPAAAAAAGAPQQSGDGGAGGGEGEGGGGGGGQPVRGQWAIPYVLFASSLCFALGSGMTVKFFPLFFKNTCKMSPIAVQSVYVGVPLIMTLMSGLGTALSKRFGRVQTMVALKVVGVSLLVSMAFLKDAVVGADGDDEPNVPMLVLLVAVYLMRSALMNCTYPLEESILMDFVPSNTRARWKSLDSVSVFGWCGSAALGGYLADLRGYTFTFLVTASVQAVATLMQASLMLVVPRKEQPTSEPHADSAAPADTATEPLQAAAAAPPRTPTRTAADMERAQPVSEGSPGIQ